MHKTNVILSVATALSLSVVIPAQQLAPKTQATPEGLTAGQWTSIRAAYEAGRHAVSKVDGIYQARNPGQGWLTRFEDGGFEVKPDAGAWTWGLELKSYGFAGNEQEVSTPPEAQADGGRMSYRWDAVLDEWYINDTRGLEHGYTLHQRPAREAGNKASPLAFTLAVRGGLSLQITNDRRGVRFVDQSGGTALTYTGLTVFDAAGKAVPARFERRGDLLRLLVEESDARYPLTIDPLVQQAYVKASNTEAYDYFGSAVSVSGDTVVVGAPGEGSKATGINGDQTNNSSPSSGAAYVFVRSGTAWTQQAYLKASNTDQYDAFGISVANFKDTIVVGARGEDNNVRGINQNQHVGGAPESGAVYVFVRRGTTWSQQAYVKASNTDMADRFGCSVALTKDTMVVGASGEDSNATGYNGSQANTSTHRDSGAVYVYVRRATVWLQQAYLKASNTGASDNFGASVSVDGGVVGGVPGGTVLVGAWAEASNGTGVNSPRQGDNSAAWCGAAYVLWWDGRGWIQQAYLKASNAEKSDDFGWSVAISGDTAVVGALWEASNATGINGDQSDNSMYGAGATYVFVRSGSTWSQQAYLKSSNTQGLDHFGRSVDISGDSLVVGADGKLGNSGAAYVFARGGSTWRQQTYLRASNAAGSHRFGYSVSLSGDTVVVGARSETSNAKGINGNQNNNTLLNAGAAYVFASGCRADSTQVGTGCIATGVPPQLSVTPPVQGKDCVLSVKSALPRTVGVILLGIQHKGIALGPKCVAYFDLTLPTIPVFFSTDATGGWLSAPIAVGTSASLTCVELALQAGLDNLATAPLGMALSNGVWATIGY